MNIIKKRIQFINKFCKQIKKLFQKKLKTKKNNKSILMTLMTMKINLWKNLIRSKGLAIIKKQSNKIFPIYRRIYNY